MHDHVTQDFHLPRLRVDRDHRRMTAARECEGPLGIEGFGHLQTSSRDDLDGRKLSRRGTAHGDESVLHDQVLHVRLELLRAAIEYQLAHCGCRLRCRVANLHRAPAARGEECELGVLGVARADVDTVERPAKAFRDD